MNTTKSALTSKGFVGPLIAVVATLFDFSAGQQTVLVEVATLLAQVGGGLMGAYGRWVATSKIDRII
ncbi:MAG: hypothetical protein AAF141_05970 [Pseudomonadota bacterium]